MSCDLLTAIGSHPNCRRSIFDCGLGGMLTVFEPTSGAGRPKSDKPAPTAPTVRTILASAGSVGGGAVHARLERAWFESFHFA